MERPKIVGIVNITTDSFSDGGKFLDANLAIEQAKKLLADGANIIELSGVSSNPHAEHVPADVEIQRITPVLAALDCPISIDATKPEVQRFALSSSRGGSASGGKNVALLNDIRGFPDESMYDELAKSDAKLVVMHFISDLDKAVRVPKTPKEVFDSIYSFFEKRLPQLTSAGISKERIVIDPGMGFFLASNPEPSLAVLAHIAEFKKRFKLPVMISVSRKSFLKNLAPSPDVDIQSRTLAAELFGAQEGVDYIRTHDVRALYQGLQTLEAIERVGNAEKPQF
ncbi:dihydropteroate synthase [Candidatus Kaiserbacteria bacterium RIFCSPLOWO2_12_FULL_53_8]|uniref:Dihydropteroate synthase n=2 Tax=Candidatus Kaiseribacteriota TaxID=1752734 RepID=A0A1F6CUM0_9BACT|nr:MAG: dihydropteroate synthase [Candidatus Kaiserbacteria bacterium RIFCSPHIGHO2_01_FULL_53_29]OGG90833.1 MAG: dihydropteroate synthase [Candidatus Kaiserbacteria bacterium RIFCSPLOWO2_12_FULL_53_8]